MPFIVKMKQERETERITKEFLLVIEHTNNKTNEQIDIEKFITTLKIFCEFYAIILHDNDTKEDEEGNIIQVRKHYHVIIKLNKRSRKMTILKQLAMYNNIPPEMIQIEYMENFILSIRYLLHLDDTEKYQYAPFQIQSSNYPIIERIIETEIYPNEITAKYIIHLIYTMEYSLTKILEIIGLKNFNKYARTISIVKQEFTDNRLSYINDNKKELPF